ncbi:sequence-specific DNA binding transcription factor [Abeliophyllum distichum]|uniref:Sequence-specific DNA binding transcription factor n=1 Tax=Abeliophyllum distichum TaxID=126358 RepID=A0ABD1SY65_9LAMI
MQVGNAVLFKTFKLLICEGLLYVMRNFVTGYNSMKLKAMAHAYKLNFMSKTLVIEVGDDSFSLQIYVSRPFGELLSAPDVDEIELFEKATSTLVDAWDARYLVLNRGNLRSKDWQDVADGVTACHGHTKRTRCTDVQCKNQIDTLKKKFKTEKAKIAESNGTVTSSWPFFSRIDVLIGPNLNKQQARVMPVATPVVSNETALTSVASVGYAFVVISKNYSAMAAAATAAAGEDEVDAEE